MSTDTSGLTGTDEREARALAARVEQVGAWVEATVDELAALVAGQLSGPRPRRADLDIEGPCRALLEQREVPLAGAGFVAETGVLRDAPYWLEWWTANPDIGIESCRRLAADTDPTSVGFRDYTELPWFVTPRESGSIQVTGPYVDYVCTDQHTLTVTQPVVVGSTFVGVVGVDLLAATVERLLGPDLDSAAGVHVVVNRVGRVVAASDPEYVVGDLVAGLPGSSWFTGRRRSRRPDLGAANGAGPGGAADGGSGDGERDGASEGGGWGLVTCADLPLAILTALP